MKLSIHALSAAILMTLTAATTIAAEFSAEELHGKWTFSHILMDGTSEMKVNTTMEFLADGTIVNYDASGNEKSRGSFSISGDYLLYVDDKGEQKWKLVSFEDNKLHFDHRGAEMFFVKQ